MVPERIEREIVVAAPVERVWAALTEADQLRQWFGDAAEVDLRPGGAMVNHWEGHGNVLGVVEKVEPPHFFSYRWARPIGAEPRDGNTTLVEFTLTPERDGTRLRVVESGFRELDAPERDRATYAGENTEGWKMELDELRVYLERAAA